MECFIRSISTDSGIDYRLNQMYILRWDFKLGKKKFVLLPTVKYFIQILLFINGEGSNMVIQDIELLK